MSNNLQGMVPSASRENKRHVKTIFHVQKQEHKPPNTTFNYRAYIHARVWLCTKTDIFAPF